MGLIVELGERKTKTKGGVEPCFHFFLASLPAICGQAFYQKGKSISRLSQDAGFPRRNPSGNPSRLATLCHSYTILPRQNNGDPKVIQGLLRHNSIKVTMDIYDEAMSDEKQMAHRNVLRLLTRKQDRTVMRTASGTGVRAST